jgi:hypothetical protein
MAVLATLALFNPQEHPFGVDCGATIKVRIQRQSR